MECNKEEAVRAKEIAERKMQSKDFVGAQKIALKAQQLYPGLENISQILTVCEVHVSAEVNVVGSEMDWYGILQVPQTADELFIKKQYRKLAFALHPDKNKFPGAEAAFKLIGEANRVLSDLAKRSLYDIKRQTNIQTAAPMKPPQTNRYSYAKKQPGVQNNYANHCTSQYQGMSKLHQQTQIPPTFWTCCPFCNTKYQHNRTLLSRVICCRHCMKPFVAYDMNVQGGPPGANSGCAWNQSAASQHKDTPSQGANQAGQQSTTGNSSSGMQCQGNASRRATVSEPFSKARTSAEVDSRSRRKASEDGDAGTKRAEFEEKRVEMNRRAHTGKSSGKVGLKRGRRVAVETKESCDSESPDVEDVGQVEEKEMESSSIKKKKKESSKDADNLEVKSSGASNSETQDPIDYPEPEFHDFDEDRVPDHFRVDQIWAVYDNADGMPRWYVRIRKIYSNYSRLRITWLEANPKDQYGLDWLEVELPVACGNFRSGDSQDTEDLRMFSHLASWGKGDSRGTYKIYPRKGDVWALLKDWSIQWSSSPDAHRKYEFEFVVVLCDYAEETGVEVACLVMLEGFTSLFRRMENVERNPFQVPPNELLRFSHRVPCYRMTREERKGIPAGYFELDPASVFTEDFSPPKVVDIVFNKSVDIESNTLGSEPGTEKETLATGPKNLNTAEDSTSPNDNNNRNIENLEKGSCSKPGTEKEIPAAVQPDKLNGAKCTRSNGKVIQNKENLDHKSCSKSGTEMEMPATGPDMRNATKKNTSPNEKIENKDNLVNRRCSPRAHEKKPGQVNASQHAAEEGKCLHGGPGSLDDMLNNKPSDLISAECQTNGEEKTLFPGKAPPNIAADENCPPDLVFHNFESEKLEKLHKGQIWALYSSQDGGLPKYYVRIKEVESPEFKVQSTWLDACPESEKEIWWSKKELPVACGKFKVRARETETFESASTFSHRVRYSSTRGGYLIFPREGEVWAIYKNWSAEWTFIDLKHCEYEMVKVLKDSDLAIKVLVLEMVDGFKAVYRGAGVEMDIPRNELLRFSHLVPSFGLTEERGGKLNGYLELDPAALPDSFFSKNS